MAEAAQGPQAARARSLAQLLRDPVTVRQSMLLREVLGPPMGLRPERDLLA